MSTTTTTTVRFIHVPSVSAMKKEDTTPPIKPRKGSRTSTDSSKKPRGRPRLEPHDETAADRRRTQVRLAQRAYRQRKETTIVALKQRVSELKQSVDQINQSFSAFHSKATSCGIQDMHAELAHELGETSHLISRLHEEAKVDQDESFDDPLPRSPKQDSDDAAESPASDSGLPIVAPIQPRPPTQTATVQLSQPDSSWGSGMVWEPTEPTDTASQPDPASVSTGISSQGYDANLPAWMEPFLGQSTDDSSSDRSEEDQQWPLHILGELSTFAPELSNHLPLPRTGAIDESTFARRLHRATLERGVHIIQAGRMKPRDFARQFQICLPFCDRAQLLVKIQNMLSRDNGQPLDWSDHPLVHLGGAGLHYQDYAVREPTSSSKLGEIRVRAIGPSTLALLMNATEQDNTMGKALDIAGFEGEWFSPNDVEGYLAQQGVHIDSGARLQEITALESDEQSMTNVIGKEPDRQSPHRRSLDYLQLRDSAQAQPGQTVSQASGDASEQSIQLMAHDWTTGQAGQQPPLQTASDVERHLSARQFVERRTMWVDVDKLVKELVNRATCIGRTPGYRRRDVDRAFKRSVAAH